MTMKKKYLAVFMMATALTLTACGAKDTAGDSQQAEEQVTEITDENTSDSETAENSENKITELTVDTPAEFGGQEFYAENRAGISGMTMRLLQLQLCMEIRN